MMVQAVISEVLPWVETAYRVSRKPEDRAMAGLSMGGRHTLNTLLAHPGTFRWIGAFSSAVPEGNMDTRFPEAAQALKSKKGSPRLLWLGIGREDSLLARNEEFAAWLKANGIPFTWKTTEGGHEWTLWRAYFAEFAAQLFR